LPLGSNRSWALSLLAAAVWAGVALGLVQRRQALWQGRWPHAVRAAAPLLALAFACSAWVALQLALHNVWPAVFYTQDVHATRLYLLRTLVYAGGMLWVALAVRRRAHVLWVLGSVLGSGLLQSVLAVALYAHGQPFDFLFERLEPQQRASGTFVNPDHLAGHLELALSAGLGLMLALMSPGGAPRRGWRAHLTDVAAFVMSPKMLVRLSLVPLVIGLVMTRSRMGNGAFFMGIVLVGLMVAWRSTQWRRPALFLVASMLVVDLVVIGQWVGLDAVVKRVSGTAEASSSTLANLGLSGKAPPPTEGSLQERLMGPMAALPLVAERPVGGWGGGNFALAFAPIKPDSVYHGWWDHAHNDFIQVAVDMGLPGLLLWLSIGFWALRRILPLLGDGHAAVDRGVAVAALTALVCLGLHSWVDFNLQIPANALALSVLLALLAVLPGLASEPQRRRRLHSSREE
jgi:O-antigen ligase